MRHTKHIAAVALIIIACSLWYAAIAPSSESAKTPPAMPTCIFADANDPFFFHKTCDP